MAIDAATPHSEPLNSSGQFSTFFVAGMFFGVDVLHVQEVLCAQQMSPVPQAPEVIEGLINLRGQIVTAIDMRRRLDLPARTGDQAPMNMVVRTSDGAVSLLVDEIGDVLALDSAQCERPPDNLDAAARELILGVYKLKDQLLLVLDTERAVEVGSIQSTRNGRFEAPNPDGAKDKRRSLVPVPNEVAKEALDAAQPQALAGKENKKAVNRKASATTLGA